MIPVELTAIKTRDGIILNGIVANPSGQKHDVALVWIHGLGSNFYSGRERIRSLADACRKNAIGYFNFNTRGHDIVARNGGVSRAPAFFGAAFERFEDCVHDIRAVMRFAHYLGYKRIILAGHSTGANKALYYCYRTRDRAIKGLALVAPISDHSAETKKIGRAELATRLRFAHKLTKKRDALMPLSCGVIAPKRYRSLFLSGSKEDVFPYYNPRAQWKELTDIRVPLAVILGSRDQHRDRPAKKLIETFRDHATRAASFTGAVIPSADHGFAKKEPELATAITDWIKRAVVYG